MASNRRKYFKKNKKSIRREQKHTVNGWLSAGFGCAAVVLFVVSVIRSFLAEGNSDVLIGTAGLLGFVFAVGALALGILTFKQKNVRPVPPRTGVLSGGILSVVFCALYVYGMIA